MADTVRTISALQTILADNGANDINAQDLRDFLVSTVTRLDSEISVTGAVTLTLYASHVCTDSGSPANYAITLPAASGNTGARIWVRIDDSMTKLATLTGHSSELINGSNTRVMQAGEACELVSDGTGWAKIGGKSIPMQCSLSLSAGSSVTAATWTVVALDTPDLDVGGMADVSNNRIDCLRPGTYCVSGGCGFAGDGTGGAALPNPALYCISAATKSTSSPDTARVVQSIGNGDSGGYALVPFTRPVVLAAGEYVALAGNISATGAFFYGGPFGCVLSVAEINLW